MKKSKIISLLKIDSSNFSKIAREVGCDRTYVGRIASILNIPNRIPIMDFKGLLKGDK